MDSESEYVWIRKVDISNTFDGIKFSHKRCKIHSNISNNVKVINAIFRFNVEQDIFYF